MTKYLLLKIQNIVYFCHKKNNNLFHTFSNNIFAIFILQNRKNKNDKKNIYYINQYVFFYFQKNNNFSKKNVIKNFYQAKLISIKIHQNAPGSFYCGCKIIWKQKKGIPDLYSCGYKIRKNKNRATRIEWEHVVPAWQFGHNKKCWKKGGRKKCISDIRYKYIESDLHNLQPAIGEINGDRSNFTYGQLNNKISQYGKCNMKIDFQKKIAEPPERARGAISRTYFYMSTKYNIILSKKEEETFKIWNKNFPVTKWECEREKLIFKIQGNHNNYIYKQCHKK